MKKILTCLLFCGLIVPLHLFLGGSDSFAVKEQTKQEESQTQAPQTQSEPAWDERYPSDLSSYLSIPSPVGIEAQYEDPSIVTQEEIGAVIDQIRLGRATFEEKEEGVVERFDKVTLAYQVVLEGRILEEYTEESLVLVVGSETNEEEKAALAERLVGAKRGEMRWADYRYPETEASGDLAGKTVVTKGVVTGIQRAILPEVNEAFVRQMKGFETAELADFYRSVEEDIRKQKEENRLAAVWTAFTEQVQVFSYPEKNLQGYQNDYLAYYYAFAKSVDMELEAFLEEFLEINKETFDAQMLSYAQEMVRNDMIFTQLIRDLSLTLTDQEYQEGIRGYYENETESFGSLNDFEVHYTKQRLWENLLHDKALAFLVENSVPKG